MAFLEQQLPPRISKGAQGGPLWSTQVSINSGGARSANQLWSAPLHRYNVAHSVRDNETFELLRAFFYIAAGRANGFRFKDWTDFQATQANSRLTNITGSTWQLQRVYAYGASEFLRDIVKPLAGAVVYRTRSGVVSVAAASVSTTTGIATISGHVAGDTYTWVGEFDVPVAFVDDKANWAALGTNLMLMEWPEIMLEEIRQEWT